MLGPTYAAILGHITYFLTVAIHTILAERHVYPVNSFITARAYNLPVRQSRHPEVCSWIHSAVAAVRTELVKGTVARVVVAIAHPETFQVLERFVFDMERLPQVPKENLETPLMWTDDPSEPVDQAQHEHEEEDEVRSAQNLTRLQEPQLVDLTEQLRATLASISVCRRRLRTIPQGCTFTVAIELKDEAEPPIDIQQPWIPVQPEGQRVQEHKDDQGSTSQSEREPATSSRRHVGSGLGGRRVIPVRTVDTEDIALEMWVEEAAQDLP